MYYNDQDQEQAFDEQMGMDMGMNMRMNMGMGTDMGTGMGMGMGQGISSSDLLLIDDIRRAIILEVHAYNFYNVLKELTMDAQERQVIRSIQHDEARHYHWFTMILRMMGGEFPYIPEGPLPIDLISGLRKAIHDELEANAFYQYIAYRAASHHIQMHFMHASHDEQRHASLLQDILMNYY